MPRFEVTIQVERADLDADLVRFGLPWTDVVGPKGEISIGDPLEIGEIEIEEES